MDEYTNFPILYSTDKKLIDTFMTDISAYCRTFKDYIELYRKLKPGVEIKNGSIDWCIEYEDLRGNMRVKKEKTKGWYLEIPAAYMF